MTNAKTQDAARYTQQSAWRAQIARKSVAQESKMMVKRKVKPATPKQKAARAKWQAAGVAARKAKAQLHEGTITLYHGAKPWEADQIMAEGFRGRGYPIRSPERDPKSKFFNPASARWGPEWPVYFTNRRYHARAYGSAVLSITIPKSSLGPLNLDYVNEVSLNPKRTATAYAIGQEALKGIRIRRIKRKINPWPRDM